MDDATELGEFLKSRRAALDPAEVGIVTPPTRRRVTGLRREELAMLAGVSITHYTRMEQGRVRTASDAVLEAIARALRLTEDETTHLKDLARPVARHRGAGWAAESRVSHADPLLRQLLMAMDGVPALVLDRRYEVLAWNRLGHALLAWHLDPGSPCQPASRPNLMRMLFLDDTYRALYADWDEEAELAVASLRLVAGRHPHDRMLVALIRQLRAACPDFAARWARHPVRSCTPGVKALRHPVAGPLDLGFQALDVPGSPGHRLVTYTAAPGSRSQEALRRLAAAGAAAREPGPGRGRGRAGRRGT